MNILSKWQQLFCTEITPIQSLPDFQGIKLLVKRDDLNHPFVQGNKLRKLKFNFLDAINNEFSKIATFGGAWSNHILATAHAAKICSLDCIGFIRGDELQNKPYLWSKTLSDAHELGMELIFLRRDEYRLKLQSQQVKLALKEQAEGSYFIPEGGSNSLALTGVSETIPELIQQMDQPTHIITAVGTGGTLAGLVKGVSKTPWNKTKIIGIPVLKNALSLQKEIEFLISNNYQGNWKLYGSYHCGGYAKTNKALCQFGSDFVHKTGIDLDRIYTSKSFYAAYNLIQIGEIPVNSRVLILHTGGLQGGSIVDVI